MLCYRRIFLAVGIAMAVLFFGSALFADVKDIPAWEVKPPEKPVHDIWLDDESLSEQYGWNIVDQPSCYGGRELNLNGYITGDHTVKFSFDVKVGGEYLVSVAGQPAGTTWSSPFWYSIDNGEWQHVTAVACSGVSWGISGAISWMNLALANLTEGKHSFFIKVNEYRHDGGYAYMVDAVSLLRDPYIRLNLPPMPVTDQPGNVFVQSSGTAFHLKNPVSVKQMNWRVVDWHGKESCKGIWDTTSSQLVLPRLQLGYYALQVKVPGETEWGRDIPFARVVDPASRMKTPDSPFAVDSAQSWFGSASNTPGFKIQPSDPNKILSDLEYLAGVSAVRYRYGWDESEPGKIQYTPVYTQTSDMLTERGIQVTRMFQNAPDWACLDGAQIPNDLMAIFKFAKASAEKYAKTVPAWEFWNEEDAAGYQISAWDFAAAQKAAYLGLKAGSPKANVLVGSSCGHPVPRFMDMLMENGAGEYFDIYNFHLYTGLDQYPLVVKDEYGLLKRHGVGHKPMWITENGFYKGGSGKPLVAGSVLTEYTPDEERSQAEYLVKAQIILQSLGVARDFSFIFRPYNENNIAWGMLRWDYTPKIAYAALANLTAKLSGCRYLGGVKLGAGVRGFLYCQRDKRQTVVYWSEKGNRKFKITNCVPKLRVTDLVGGETIQANNHGSFTLQAGKYPVYVCNLTGLKPQIDTRIAVAEKPRVNSKNDLSVVVQLSLKDGFSNFTKNIVTIDSRTTGHVVLNVYNFSNKPKRGKLTSSSGCSMTGLPDSILLPPMEKVSIPVQVKMTSKFLVKLRICGEFGGKQILPVCVQLLPSDAQIDPRLKVRTISTVDPKRWLHNSSGKIEITEDREENAVRVDLVFQPNTDHWAYPSFSLKLPSESLAGAAGVSFEIKSKRIDPSGFGAALLMIGMDEIVQGGVMHYFPYTPKTEWQTVYVSFDADAPVAFNAGDIKRLAIGANPVQNDYVYWIRNIKAYYKKR